MYVAGMDLWRVIKAAAFAAFAVIFAVKVKDSVEAFKDGRIGTSAAMVVTEDVDFPVVTACSLTLDDDNMELGPKQFLGLTTDMEMDGFANISLRYRDNYT